MAESWRNGWGWSQRSTSGEARGGWALRELRKLLPPCQLTCKAGCSRCASRAGQVEKEGVLALQGAAGETLKLRPCSACCWSSTALGGLRESWAPGKTLLLSLGWPGPCPGALLDQAQSGCWAPSPSAGGLSGGRGLLAEGGSRCQTHWPLDVPPLPALAEGRVSPRNYLLIL